MLKRLIADCDQPPTCSEPERDLSPVEIPDKGEHQGQAGKGHHEVAPQAESGFDRAAQNRLNVLAEPALRW